MLQFTVLLFNMPIHILSLSLSLRRHEILDWTQSNSDCLRDPAQNPLLSEGDFKLQLRLIQPTKVIESNLTILLRTRKVFCVFLLYTHLKHLLFRA